MTALDIVVLLLMGGNALLGVTRGFTAEVLSMLALVLAIAAVRLFHAPLTDLLTVFVGTGSGAAVLSFALLFGIVWYGGKMLAGAIGGRMRSSAVGPVDRVLGGGFGALKGLLIATVVFVGFAIGYDTLYGAGSPRPAWLRESRTYPLLNASGRAMSEWLAERRRQGGVLGGEEEPADESASQPL